MAPRKARRGKKGSKNKGMDVLPLRRINVPRDSPQFEPITPISRVLQLEYTAPSSGSTISPTCADFFLSTYGTSQYNACVIKRIRIWSGIDEEKVAELTVQPGSPWGNTVPTVTFTDHSAVLGDSARVGYHLGNAFLSPWSKAATFAVIKSTLFPIIVEFSAVFM